MLVAFHQRKHDQLGKLLKTQNGSGVSQVQYVKKWGIGFTTSDNITGWHLHVPWTNDTKEIRPNDTEVTQ